MSHSIQRRRFNSAQSRQGARRRAVRAAVGCAVESLEERRLFSTLTVNTVANGVASDGTLSLHEAIELIEYNGDPGAALGRSLDGGESAQIDTSTDPFGTNDTIIFDNLIAGQTITFGSEITISGTMVIDGGSAGMTLSGGVSQATWRAFYVDSTADLTLNHLTITNFSNRGADGNVSAGGDGKGGAIYVDQGTLTITNSTLSNNSATGGRGDGAAGGMGLGGAIYIDQGSVTITGSTLNQNAVAGNQEKNYSGAGGAAMGGAIYNTGGTLTVTDSTLSNNSATGGEAYNLGSGGDADGGAVYVDSAGTVTVTDSTLSNNSATGGEGYGGAHGGNAGGGALYVDQTGTLTVTGAITLLSNTATGGDGSWQGGNAAGGAIANHGGAFTLAISGGTVEQNAAVGGYSGPSDGWGQGGAIYSANGTASLTFTNSTLSNNSVTADANGIGEGGALFVDSNTLTVTNSTLAGNSAVGGSGGQGGAIYVNFGDTTISFSTLSGNTAAGGGRGLYDVSGNTLQIDNSILGQSDNSVTDLEGSATTVSGSNNLIRNTAVTGIGILSTADPKLGPLQDNGGPTQTMLPVPDSPALDAADDTLGGAPSTDQRGAARPAGAYDIGAAEFTHVTLTVSSTADADTRDADLTLREAIELANGTLTYADLTAGEQAWLSGPLGDAYAITFDPSVAGQTIYLGSQINVSGTMTIDGGTSGMTLSGGVSQATWRAFYVTSTGDLTLDKLTITNFSNRGTDGSLANGGDGRGGAIYVDQGTLAITNSTLSNNSAVGGIGSNGNGGAGQGGAVYSNSGTVTITNSTLDNNAATGGNGYNGNANAGQGGAVYNTSGTVTIANSTLDNNAATGGDGSNGNGGAGQGGAVYSNSGTVTITAGTLAGNSAAGGEGSNGFGASGQGGAVYSGSGDLTISNATLANNTAAGAYGNYGLGSGQGGAIYVADGLSTLSFSTVSSNTATQGGRGFYVSSSGSATVQIDNSILGQADNTVTDLEFSGTVTASGSNNLIRNTAVTGIGNLSTADPKLGPLQDNGGPTQTMRPAADSPAIDAADDTLDGAPFTDQRGIARPAGAFDIGAAEFTHVTLTVSSTADADTRDSDLSLREAIEVANGTLTYADLTAGEQAWASGPLGDAYTITFDSPIAGGIIFLGSAITASGTMAIDGGTTGMTLYGSNSRAFYVTSTGDLTLNKLTITNFRNRGANGSSSPGGDGNGGAIYVDQGTLTITDGTLSNNSAVGGAGDLANGGNARGGAIYVSHGTVTLTGSTLAYNSAAGGYGDLANGGFAQGGAIYVDQGTLTIIDSTLANNSATGGYGDFDDGSGEGGAAYVVDGNLTLSFSTVSSNTAAQGGRGLYVSSSGAAVVEIDNSILGQADNSVTDVEFSGTVTASGSHNLIRNTAETGVGNLSSADPRLAPLGDYGGSVQTFALLPDSPALDAAGAAGAVTQDVRGAARGYNGTSDIGSFESQGYTLTLDSGSTPQSALAGQTFDNPLAVTLTENGFDAPIPGATITFTAPSSGSPSVTVAATATTDSGGDASVTPAANDHVGSYTVTASLGGPQDATGDFALTNTAIAPSITSANHATFTVGSAGTFTIVTTGTPDAVLSQTGTLPPGLTFTDNGDGTATLSGTPFVSGTFTLTITAANGATTDATQTLTLSVTAAAVTGTAPTITSPDHFTLPAGQAGSFTVTTTGSPIAALHVTGTLPDGVTFVDNGDGTGTFSGVTAATLTGAYAVSVVADNVVGQPATQAFTITVAGQHPVIVTSGDSRGSIQVNNPDGSNRFTITSPFQHSGARLASGDVTGDGVPDIIAAAGPGSRARVVVYDGLTGSRVNGFRAFAKKFTGGIFVTTGDVDGDGTPDLIVSQGAGGASRTRIFSGADGSVLTTFQVPGTSAAAGASVASADLNGDGFADVITASGSGDRYATVRVLDGRALGHDKVKYLTTLSPDRLGFTGGAFVTTGDVDGDGTPDLIVSQATGAYPVIDVFNGKKIAHSNLKAALITSFHTASSNGARVASYDVNADGLDDIIASVTVNGSAKLKFFNGSDGSLIDALTSDNTGGVFVA